MACDAFSFARNVFLPVPFTNHVLLTITLDHIILPPCDLKVMRAVGSEWSLSFIYFINSMRTHCLYCFLKNKELIHISWAKFWPIAYRLF